MLYIITVNKSNLNTMNKSITFKKALNFILSIGNILFVLIALYMAVNFYQEGQTEQTLISLFFSCVSFYLYTQLSKK